MPVAVVGDVHLSTTSVSTRTSVRRYCPLMVLVATEADTPSARASSPTSTRYRPHIDGLRAVAVYLVVAFHSGIERLSGGFIGVDVFFVLSGYLVTKLLLRELLDAGTVRFGRFYSRRFRRLLPAVFVMLLVTAVVYAGVASAAELSSALGGFRAAFLYVANWYFIGQETNYFAPHIETSPVLHLWSLSVEEQFYLALPVLLVVLHTLTRRARAAQWRIMRSVVAVGAGISLLLALRLQSSNPAHAYYGTDTRAYQLLAGALLAMTPALFRASTRVQKLLQLLAGPAIVALVIVASRWVEVGPITRGIAATIVTCAIIVALENAKGGLVRAGLSTTPIVYLGRVSYGTYLWHWPIVLLLARVVSLNSPALFALTCLLATALASLSFQLLEWPVRHSRSLDAYVKPVIACGVAASLVGGLLVMPRILDSGRSPPQALGGTTQAGSGLARIPKDLDWKQARSDYPGFPYCIDDKPEGCVLVHGTGAHIMLIGDSMALGLLTPFEAIARKHSLTFSAAIAPACPWQIDLIFALFSDACRKYKADWYERVIPALSPDIVVLFDSSIDDPQNPLGHVLDEQGRRYNSGTPEFESLVRDTSAKTLARLRQQSDGIVIVEPLPVAPPNFDSVGCLSSATYFEECRFVASGKRTAIERYYESAAGGDVVTLDLDQQVCPYLPICDPVVDGRIVRSDGVHLTARFAGTLAGPIYERLVRDGVLRQ
jgi:peptidoglycan/LPS O-acetylase OafA/YrhL